MPKKGINEGHLIYLGAVQMELQFHMEHFWIFADYGNVNMRCSDDTAIYESEMSSKSPAVFWRLQILNRVRKINKTIYYQYRPNIITYGMFVCIPMRFIYTSFVAHLYLRSIRNSSSQEKVY